MNNNSDFMAGFGIPIKVDGFVEAITPLNYFIFFDDFMDANASGSTDLKKWNVKVAAGGTVALTDTTDASHETTGGIVTLTPSATASDYVTMIGSSEAFQIKQGYPLFYIARFMTASTIAANQNIYAGMGVSTAAPSAGLGNGVMFTGLSTGVCSFTCTNATSAKAITIAPTITTSTWYRVGIQYDGYSKVRCFFGTDKSTADPTMACVAEFDATVTTDYVPTGLGLAPEISCESKTTNSTPLIVDYVFAGQRRYPYSS